MTEVSGLKPNLRRFTEEELDAIDAEAQAAIASGDDAAFDKAIQKYPMMPILANDFKVRHGIEWLIKTGANLSEAVEEYGEEWLRN